MKFNTQGLALVIVFQLIILGATLSITATNAGAVPLPCAVPYLLQFLDQNRTDLVCTTPTRALDFEP